MTAEAFLNRIKYFDEQINTKLEQVEDLRALSTKITTTFSDMPHSPNSGNQTMAHAIDKIIDLEKEIDAEIDKLVDAKREVREVIDQIADPTIRLVLEQRYLCYNHFETIADRLGLSDRWIQTLNARGIKEVERILAQIK